MTSKAPSAIGLTAMTLTTSVGSMPVKLAGCAFEAPGVEPLFLDQEQALDYAKNRACVRSGEIRILDSSGNVERTVHFSEANRRLELANFIRGQKLIQMCKFVLDRSRRG